MIYTSIATLQGLQGFNCGHDGSWKLFSGAALKFHQSCTNKGSIPQITQKVAEIVVVVACGSGHTPEGLRQSPSKSKPKGQTLGVMAAPAGGPLFGGGPRGEAFVHTESRGSQTTPSRAKITMATKGGPPCASATRFANGPAHGHS